MGLGETPRRLIRKRCGYSSLEKLEDAFCTVLDLMQAKPEAVGEVIFGKFVRPTVLDKWAKFRDPCLNHSREIPPEAFRNLQKWYC